MLKIGITGGIGSGKSTICKLFELLGIPTYYADEEARRLMQEDETLKNQLIEVFGSNIYAKDGLNRKLLSDIVFKDSEKISALNKLVHPAVHRDFNKWALAQNALPYVLEEAALIFESGGNKNMDKVILVTAPVELRIKRVMVRNSIPASAVQARIDQQWSDEKKLPLCDFVIINDGIQSIIRQVVEVHSILMNEIV